MPREGYVSVFFGLGPRGDITESILRERIEEICPANDLRMRDRFAFVDCTQENAAELVRRLHGWKIGSSTLTCQISKRDDPAKSRRDRGDRDKDVRRRDDSRDRRRDRSRRRDDSRDRRRRDDSRDRRRRDDSRDRRRRRDDSREVRRRDDSRDRRRRDRDDSRSRHRDDSRDRRRDRDNGREEKRYRREEEMPPLAPPVTLEAPIYDPNTLPDTVPAVDITSAYQTNAVGDESNSVVDNNSFDANNVNTADYTSANAAAAGGDENNKFGATGQQPNSPSRSPSRSAEQQE